MDRLKGAMGASKRAAEMVCQQLSGEGVATRFVTVRFGNVLASAGSVVPLFREQIGAGGPVTVTHPEVKRYFMTIPEACQLIMEAGTVGRGGELYVLDMGEPVTIGYLAEQMIALAGKTPGEDVEIQFIGLRPGEKLFEELFHERENLAATSHEKILLARHREMEWAAIRAQMTALFAASEQYDEPGLLRSLESLVPEYAQTRGASAHSNENVIPIDKVKR